MRQRGATAMSYYSIVDNRLTTSATPPPGAKLFKHQLALLLPPLVTELHRSFRAWGDAGYSPAEIDARRIYFNAEGELAFHFMQGYRPQPLLQVGPALDLAAWLVLLDKWMETFVVIARARTVWRSAELSSALTFLNPAYLSAKLVAHPPDNWERVAQALAAVVADGELRGSPTNRHWQKRNASVNV